MRLLLLLHFSVVHAVLSAKNCRACCQLRSPLKRYLPPSIHLTMDTLAGFTRVILPHLLSLKEFRVVLCLCRAGWLLSYRSSEHTRPIS